MARPGTLLEPSRLMINIPTSDTFFASTEVAYTEQAEPVQATARVDEQNDSMIGFFVVGAVINIIVISAFIYWAYKQWNGSGRGKDREK